MQKNLGCYKRGMSEPFQKYCEQSNAPKIKLVIERSKESHYSKETEENGAVKALAELLALISGPVTLPCPRDQKEDFAPSREK